MATRGMRVRDTFFTVTQQATGGSDVATSETKRYPNRGHSENVRLQLSAVDVSADDGASVAVYFDRPARFDGLLSAFYEVSTIIAGSGLTNLKMFLEFKVNPYAHDSNDDWFSVGTLETEAGVAHTDTGGGGIQFTGIGTAVASYPLLGAMIPGTVAVAGSGPVPVYGVRLRFADEGATTPTGVFDMAVTFGVEY